MKLLAYDPEYVYNDDVGMDDDDGGWGAGSDEEEVVVNEEVQDSSWKVRRGAILVVNEIVNVHRDTHVYIINNYCVQIAERLKERVDNCKI